MTTPTKIKHLVVGTPQGIAGDLRKESRFSCNYSAHERDREISLTMPLRAESYAGGALLPIFEMNRPEGYLLYKIEEAFAKAGGLDDMRLLDIVSGEQIGGLSYARPEERRETKRRQIGLAEILTRQPTAAVFLIFWSPPTSNREFPEYSRKCWFRMPTARSGQLGAKP